LKLLAILTALLIGDVAYAASIADEVATQVRGVLPPGLALVQVSVPSGTRPATDGLAILWRGAPRAGAQSVQVQNGHDRLWARVVLAPVATVLVARRKLAIGDTIQPGDLAREERPVEGSRGMRIDPRYLDGAKVARAMAPGAVLDGGDLVMPPPVPRGTPMRVVIEVGGARVTARGVLERAAHIGERSSVRLEGAGRLIDGEVVDPTTLRIAREAP